MKRLDCEQIQDLLPDLLANRLGALEAAALRGHLQSCAECREEFEVVTAVAESRLAVPAGLETRIGHAVRGRVPVRTRWPIAAAASVAVALVGASVLLPRISAPVRDNPESVASADISGAGWFTVDDAFTSGASSLRDLSVEELERLLVELGK
ncbi:MAG: zf-HC2 domain-containing protein [Longimicrobiales bacterium]